MSMSSFYVLWGVFAVAALIVLAVAGKAAGKGSTGALIDERNRYSLNRFQLLMWTVIILSAFAAFFFSNGLKIPAISAELLGLIGITAASVTTAGAVKSSKDVQAEGARNQKRMFSELESDSKRAATPELRIAAIRAAAQPQVPNIPTSTQPRVAQMLLEEEGEEADKVVSVTKFQNLILTLVAGVAVVVMVVDQKTLDLTLTDNFLWLLGISHASYVGGKIPNKK